MYEAYVGLGSNIEPQTSLDLALSYLKDEFKVQKISPWYESEPFFLPTDEPVSVPAFTNLMLIIETTLNADELKSIFKNIDNKIEPTPSKQKHHHKIDIDLYAHEPQNSQTLHALKPELLDAPYVLVPLFDIAPHLILNNNESLKSRLGKLNNIALKSLN